MRMIKHLVKTLRDTAIFNPGIQSTLSGIEWPDKDHHVLLAKKCAARAKQRKA